MIEYVHWLLLHVLGTLCSGNKVARSSLDRPIAIENAQARVVVVEGVCYNSTDDENQRARLAGDLLDLPNLQQVIIFRPTDIYEHVARLLDRSIRRAQGLEEDGTCTETSLDRARMIVKEVRQYKAVCNAIENFHEICKSFSIRTTLRDMFTQAD